VNAGGERPRRGRTGWLLIDQGGHASRAFVLDETGRTVATSEAALRTHRPRAGWVQHDAVELLSGVNSVIRDALEDLPPGMTVESAALATQRSSIVCWDPVSGLALSPVLSWQDRRNAGWLDGLRAHEPRVRQLTGLPLSAHYGASKMRWCLDSLPEVKSAASNGRLVMGPLASYLVYGLLAERPLVADPANASRTLLWDLHKQEWSRELLELFNISGGMLPACVPTRHPFGTLQVDSRVIPLQILTGDQSAAAFCAGSSDPGTAFINMGTGAFLQIFSQQPASPDLGLLNSVIYSDRDGVSRVLEGTVNGAGSALEFQAGREGISLDAVHENAGTWLRKVTDPPLFLNGVGGLGSPYWRPDFASRIIGQGDTAASIVAVLESILFLLRTNLETANPVQPVHQLILTGGLSALDPLCQRLANLTMRPVHRPGFREATISGLYHLLRPDANPPAPLGATDFQPVHEPALQKRFSLWSTAMANALGGAGSSGA